MSNLPNDIILKIIGYAHLMWVEEGIHCWHKCCNCRNGERYDVFVCWQHRFANGCFEARKREDYHRYWEATDNYNLNTQELFA